MPADFVATPAGPAAAVRVVAADGTQDAVVHLFGATLTSWRRRDDAAAGGMREMIYMSSLAALDGSKAIRGGIPIAFPHFATTPTSKLPQHGFARVSTWRFAGLTVDRTGETTAEFRLAAAGVPPALAALWPHTAAFELTYTVSLLEGGVLRTALTVANTGGSTAAAFEFTALLHTYFSVVAAPQRTRVAGLRGVAYIDKVAGGARVAADPNDAVAFPGEVDRIYVAPPVRRVEIVDSEGATAPLNVAFEGFKDVVVWNAGKDKAKAMADLDDDGYEHYVCVEVGSVAEPVVLGPGQTWSGHQIVQ